MRSVVFIHLFPVYLLNQLTLNLNSACCIHVCYMHIKHHIAWLYKTYSKLCLEKKRHQNTNCCNSTMACLDRHLWRSQITNNTKLHLYRVFILPTMLYGSECWAINKADIQWIDAVDQWCLRRILNIRWHDLVRNANIRRITNQPPLSSIIKSRCLTFFGHLAWTDENADDSQVIFEPPPENWRLPLGRLCTPGWRTFMSSLDPGINEARDLVQNRPLWSLTSLHSTTHSQWCMLLLDWTLTLNFVITKHLNCRENVQQLHICNQMCLLLFSALQ